MWRRDVALCIWKIKHISLLLFVCVYIYRGLYVCVCGCVWLMDVRVLCHINDWVRDKKTAAARACGPLLLPGDARPEREWRGETSATKTEA